MSRWGLALFGVAAILWASILLPMFGRSSVARQITEKIITEQRFRAGAIQELQAQLLYRPTSNIAPVDVLRADALIALYVAEDALTAKVTTEVDRARVRAGAAIVRSLGANPNDAFIWLLLYSSRISREGFDPHLISLLERSYFAGPREGWIALRRNQIALGVFALLNPRSQTYVLEEFSALVNAAFIDDAVRNFVSAGLPHRTLLLQSLISTDMIPREAFARRLVNDGVKVDVPGVLISERQWR